MTFVSACPVIPLFVRQPIRPLAMQDLGNGSLVFSDFLNEVTEAVVQRCSVKKVFLEISQNSQENTCARVSFLIKLQASGFFWNPFFLMVEVFVLHVLYQFHEIKLNVMKYTLNCISWNSLKEIFHSVSSPLDIQRQPPRGIPEKVFWNYAANLQENHHVEVWFQ